MGPFEFQPRQAPRRSMGTPVARRRNPERLSRPHTRSRTLVDGPPSPPPEEETEDKFSLVRKSRYYEEVDEPVGCIAKCVAKFFHSIDQHRILIDCFYLFTVPSPHLQWYQGDPSRSAACGWSHRVGAAEHLQQCPGESLQQLHCGCLPPPLSLWRWRPFLHVCLNRFAIDSLFFFFSLSSIF